MRTLVTKYQAMALLVAMLYTIGEAMAQAPPPPPTPSGAPLDGGIITFLVLSLFGGAKFLSKRK